MTEDLDIRLLWPVDAARIKPGNELSPFLAPANDARLQALSRGETADRPTRRLFAFIVGKKGGAVSKAARPSLTRKGARGHRPRLYLFGTNNCIAPSLT